MFCRHTETGAPAHKMLCCGQPFAGGNAATAFKPAKLVRCTKTEAAAQTVPCPSGAARMAAKQKPAGANCNAALLCAKQPRRALLTATHRSRASAAQTACVPWSAGRGRGRRPETLARHGQLRKKHTACPPPQLTRQTHDFLVQTVMLLPPFLFGMSNIIYSFRVFFKRDSAQIEAEIFVRFTQNE